MDFFGLYRKQKTRFPLPEAGFWIMLDFVKC